MQNQATVNESRNEPIGTNDSNHKHPQYISIKRIVPQASAIDSQPLEEEKNVEAENCKSLERKNFDDGGLSD